jgi:hypothetical protein
MKKCILLVIAFLIIEGIIVIKYVSEINDVMGGLEDCLICIPVNKNGYLTNWTLSHLITFGIAAFICPSSKYLLIFLGVLWEVVELSIEYLSKIHHNHFLTKLLGLKCTDRIDSTTFWNHYLGIRKFHPKKDLFWCSGGLTGGIMDIIADIMGVYIGIYLSKRIRF